MDVMNFIDEIIIDIIYSNPINEIIISKYS